jgi:hypothetical protein
MSRSAALFVCLFSGLALASQAPPQIATVVQCQQGVAISVDAGLDPKTPLWGAAHYEISDTNGVTGAWMEWWVGYKRYGRERVPIERHGHVVMRASRKEYKYELSPYSLEIGIYGPYYAPQIGDNYTDWSRVPYPSHEVFDYLHAGQGPGLPEGAFTQPPWPAVGGDPIRVVEQSGPTEVVLSGDVRPTSRIALLDRIGTYPDPEWRLRHYLPTTYLGFDHVRVTLPTEDVSHPAELTLMALAPDQDVEAQVRHPKGTRTIFVVSKDGPVLDAVDPESLPARPQRVVITLRGRGFSPRSRIVYFDRPDDGRGQAAEFVSPTELRVEIDVKPEAGGFYYTGSLPVSVIDGDDLMRWSESRIIESVPLVGGKVKNYTRPSIRSVSPYPIPVFDDRSPDRLLIHISGENFRRDQTVVAEVNDSVSSSERWKKLSTSYISPHELTAWLPTKLWYWTRPSYRFVIEKDGALCTADAYTSDKDFRTYSDRRPRE